MGVPDGEHRPTRLDKARARPQSPFKAALMRQEEIAMRSMLTALMALTCAAGPSWAQVAYQWPASSTTITSVANCPVQVTGGYAQMVGEPTPRVIVQTRNGDTQRAREIRLQVIYNTPSGAGRREGNFGPFRVASNQVQEVRTLSLPPGTYNNSTLTIRVTSCSAV
jgi:hypothetical protein